MLQQQIQGQPPPQMATTTIMVPVPVHATGKYESFSAMGGKCLGALLIFFGIVMIILNGVDIGFFDLWGFFGQGILAGIFYILTGSFAVCSGRYKTTCPIVTMLVLAIIAALAAIPATAMHTIGATFAYQYWYGGEHHNGADIRGVNATVAALGILGGIFCIICSALACAALSKGRSYQQTAMVTIPMDNMGNPAIPHQYAYQGVTQIQGNPSMQPQPYGLNQVGPQQPAGVPPPYTEKMQQTNLQ